MLLLEPPQPQPLGEGGRHSHGVLCVISVTLNDRISSPSRGGDVSDEPRTLVFALWRGHSWVVNFQSKGNPAST